MQTEKNLEQLIKSSISHSFDRIENYDIHYVKVGKGPPLILLHGLNIGWGQWYKNIDFFSKWYTVYAVDIPGSGRSTKIDYFTADFGEIAEVLQKFFIKNRLFNSRIISHSMSSWYATKISLNPIINVRKIIFVDPLGFTTSVPSKQKFLSFAPIARLLSKTVMSPTKQHLKQFLQESHFNQNTLEDVLIDYVHESIHYNKLSHPFSLLHRIIGFYSVRKEFQIGTDLSKLRIPIHIISGEEDLLVKSSELIKTISHLKNITFDILPHIGHVPPIECHDDFHRISHKFLQ